MDLKVFCKHFGMDTEISFQRKNSKQDPVVFETGFGSLCAAIEHD
jgi:hypothetical protein